MTRTIALAGLAASVTACLYPEKGPFVCIGTPGPTSAPATVQIGGTTIDAENQTMVLAGVSLELQTSSMMPIGAAATSDSGGNFTFTPLSTDGTPFVNLDLYATFPPSYLNMYYYLGTVTDNATFPIPMVSTNEAKALEGAFGISPGSDGIIGLTIYDCVGSAVTAATVASSSGGNVHYFDGVLPDPMANATGSGGLVLIANVPPGPTTLTATVQGVSLPPLYVSSVGGAFTQAEILPDPSVVPASGP